MSTREMLEHRFCRSILIMCEDQFDDLSVLTVAQHYRSFDMNCFRLETCEPAQKIVSHTYEKVIS